jgi:hypothetical protein
MEDRRTAPMNNGKPNQSREIDEHLACLYEFLKAHQIALYRVSVDVQATIATLKLRAKGFESDFEEFQKKALDESRLEHDNLIRKLDETIALLRGT